LQRRLSTLGNQIVDDQGNSVRLKAVNWFGGEGEKFTPNGTWTHSYKTLIDLMAGWGFNTIRLPWSGDVVTPGRMPLSIKATTNPDLVGLNALEVFDKLIDYAGTKGMWVVLDHHRRTSGSGPDGSPIDPSYPKVKWIADWETLATRYKDNITVIGADVHNEPDDMDWPSWKTHAQDCGNAIHAIAPDWLIIVEGTAGQINEGTPNEHGSWSGSNLSFVATQPIVLTKPNKLVYSPHEYGQSVNGLMSWLAYDDKPQPAFPSNMPAFWRDCWGFIFEENIAPIWIGEFGGWFGIDGSGVDKRKRHRDEERLWLAKLMQYMNGDFDLNGTSSLPAGKKGISFAYWCLNPNGGDTGGLLHDDFITPQTDKLALLAPLLT